jgi:sugar/nucleoside kinase (ribokinase family)
MTITAVGTIAYDSIKTERGQRSCILGGSATYFSLAASGLAQTNLISVVGEDFKSSDRNLFAEHRINTQGVSTLPGKTFHWEGHYDRTGNAQTIATDLNVLQEFKPVLPGSSSYSPYLFLANIDPDLQLDVLRQMKKPPKLIVGDTMNFWIESKNSSLWQVIEQLNVLIINEGEAYLLTGETNIIKASHSILKKGLPALIIKRGEYGSLAIKKDSYFAVPALPLASVTDPTGAGDSFAGGFLGYIASPTAFTDLAPEITFRKAILMGTVMASFTVEHFGTEGIQTVSREERIERFRTLEHMMQLVNLS